ncbi:Nucleoporin seh1 [Trichinella patagoniensis]|uniref:Nucleoporin seh1 n=1 Tax=Trichinella patagoniensis TaxID=990121 RepID=A0A0V1ABD7_9BILA|nr:Nucleoporin seh1 [Trichinella patagoniensis]
MRNIPIEFNDHSDMIHDVAYNFFGNRFASASSDQTVKVYELAEDGSWAFIADLKAQCGPVFRLDWAHPNFGEILATCCFNGAIVVWEETASKDDKNPQLTEWVKRTTISHERTKLCDAKFAPSHMGLIIGAAYRDAHIRIYELPRNMKLSDWTLRYEIETPSSNLSCISWNQSLVYGSLIAVGSDTQKSNEPKVFIFQYNETESLWNMLEFPCVTMEPVRDLKFAPSCGRSFELLAVACTTVQIYHLTSELPDDEDKKLCKWNVKLEAELEKAPNHTYWRLDWNIIGLELAAVDGAAVLSMWMRTTTGEWELFKRVDPNCPDARRLPGIEEDRENGNSRPASPGDTTQNDLEQSFN